MVKGGGLSDPVVLLTGAAGDIGSAVLREILSEVPGAKIAALDRRLPAELHDHDGRVGWWQCDVSDYDQLSRVVGEVVERWGTVHWCIANAGVVELAPILEVTPDSWSRQLDVNLTGAFYTAQLCAREMVRSGSGGCIVFTSSWVQNVPSMGILPYCVSKAGVGMLIKGMALELARYGIRVNGVLPGNVDAGLSRWLMTRYPERKKRALRDVPLGYLQPVESVARAILYLCSPDSSYMTGSSLLIDGGNSLYYARYSRDLAGGEELHASTGEVS